MDELVFVEPNKIGAVPFTTSDIIAQYAGVSYRSVQRLIEKQEKALSTLGQVRFEITPVKYERGTNFKKVYQLNEQQATLLITFLKNTETVVAFKVELVRQFYQMRAELLKRQIYRQDLKPIRRELTDTIRSRPDSRKWDYKLYTDLSYRAILGKTAAKIRKERGAAPKAKAVEYLTAAEIQAVSKAQGQIAVLIDMGLSYEEIKEIVLKRPSLQRAAS